MRISEGYKTADISRDASILIVEEELIFLRVLPPSLSSPPEFMMTKRLFILTHVWHKKCHIFSSRIQQINPCGYSRKKSNCRKDFLMWSSRKSYPRPHNIPSPLSYGITKCLVKCTWRIAASENDRIIHSFLKFAYFFHFDEPFLTYDEDWQLDIPFDRCSIVSLLLGSICERFWRKQSNFPFQPWFGLIETQTAQTEGPAERRGD